MPFPISYELFRAIVWLVGVPIILLLIWQVFRRLRAIRELDARLREEEAATPQNPYADMAKLYEVQNIVQENRLFGRRGKKPDAPDTDS